MLGRRGEDTQDRVTLSVTNYGPGNSTAGALRLRKKSLWKSIIRREQQAFLIHDYEDPLSGKLPSKLCPGDDVVLTFRCHFDDMFFYEDFNQIGVSDPFGRVHWCSKRQYAQAKKSFLESRDRCNAL